MTVFGPRAFRLSRHQAITPPGNHAFGLSRLFPALRFFCTPADFGTRACLLPSRLSSAVAQAISPSGYLAVRLHRRQAISPSGYLAFRLSHLQVVPPPGCPAFRLSRLQALSPPGHLACRLSHHQAITFFGQLTRTVNWLPRLSSALAPVGHLVQAIMPSTSHAFLRPSHLLW